MIHDRNPPPPRRRTRRAGMVMTLMIVTLIAVMLLGEHAAKLKDEPGGRPADDVGASTPPSRGG